MLAEEQILKAANELASKLKPTFIKSVKQNKPLLLELNDKQHDEGILNTGRPITPLYSPQTQQRKGIKNPNLLETGDYRSKKDINILPDKLEWINTDFKSPFLKGRYGDDIEGVTEGNADEWAEKVLIPVNKLINGTTRKYI